MDVKKVSAAEKARHLVKNQTRIIKPSDLVENGIPRNYLSLLAKSHQVQRVSRGVYSHSDGIIDEMAAIQARYKVAIYSHETALYLLGLTDRAPLFYSVTVPSGYNATGLKALEVKVYYIKHSLHPLGAIPWKTMFGNEVKTYQLERTICDVLRNRNQMDIQTVNEALKRYVTHRNRNIDQLYRFASQFRIQKITRELIEVLL